MPGSLPVVPFENAPIVTATFPDAAERDVFVNTLITANFNQEMDGSTINELTFLVVENQSSNVCPGLVAYTPGSRTATFSLFENLEPETSYVAIIVGNQDPDALSKVGVLSANGDAMEGNYSWIFHTGSAVTADPDLAALPSGISGYENPIYADPTGFIKIGELEVVWTDPEFAESNLPVTTQVVIQFNDNLAVEYENSFGQAVFGEASFASISGVLGYYVRVENQNVLGLPYTSALPWLYDIAWDPVLRQMTLTSRPETQAVDGYFNENGIWASGTLVTGVLEENNEYTITIKAGLEGMQTLPLYVDSHPRGDFVTFFTTRFDPLYTTPEIIRLNLGAFIRNVPDDTIYRVIHENSIAAQRKYPLGLLDPMNLPSYVVDWVICKTKLDILNAVEMGWAGSAGGRKKLADMEIEHSTLARDMDLLLKGKRDELLACIAEAEILLDSGGRVVGPDWAVIGAYSGRRPITDRSWRRLPALNPDRVQRPGNKTFGWRNWGSFSR